MFTRFVLSQSNYAIGIFYLSLFFILGSIVNGLAIPYTTFLLICIYLWLVLIWLFDVALFLDKYCSFNKMKNKIKISTSIIILFSIIMVFPESFASGKTNLIFNILLMLLFCCSFYAIFFLLSFIAKNLYTAENLLQSGYLKSRMFNFILLLFFPVGVFILHARIKKLFLTAENKL